MESNLLAILNNVEPLLRGLGVEPAKAAEVAMIATRQVALAWNDIKALLATNGQGPVSPA